MRTDRGSSWNFQWALCHQHKSTSPRDVNRLLSCNIARCSQLLGEVTAFAAGVKQISCLLRLKYCFHFLQRKQASPVISQALFFVWHPSEPSPNAFSLDIHSLLWTGKCGTHSSVSLSEKIAADNLHLFFRGVFFLWFIYNTIQIKYIPNIFSWIRNTWPYRQWQKCNVLSCVSKETFIATKLPFCIQRALLFLQSFFYTSTGLHRSCCWLV